MNSKTWKVNNFIWMGSLGFCINIFISLISWKILDTYYDPKPFLIPWLGFIAAGIIKHLYEKK